MAYTQADADNLRAAIAKGAQRLKMNGEEVEFRSLAEMKRTLADIEAELSGVPAGRMSVSYPLTGRAL